MLCLISCASASFLTSRQLIELDSYSISSNCNNLRPPDVNTTQKGLQNDISKSCTHRHQQRANHSTRLAVPYRHHQHLAPTRSATPPSGRTGHLVVTRCRTRDCPPMAPSVEYESLLLGSSPVDCPQLPPVRLALGVSVSLAISNTNRSLRLGRGRLPVSTSNLPDCSLHLRDATATKRPRQRADEALALFSKINLSCQVGNFWSEADKWLRAGQKAAWQDARAHKHTGQLEHSPVPMGRPSD